MLQNRGIAFKLTFLILTSCILIFFVIFGYNYFFSRKIILDKIKENAAAKEVMERIKKFSEKTSQSDDITILAVKYLKKKEQGQI